MSESLQAVSVQTLQNLIRLRTGIVINEHQIDTVLRLANDLSCREDILAAGGLNEYLTALPSAHPLWQEIITAVTIGETYFFRNQPQFEALRETVLPQLIEARRKSGFKQIRIWSAGCATGEEPYSLAMMLYDLLPDLSTWTVSILGTDINAAYLEYARQGLYQKRSFRSGTPPAIMERWFTAEGNSYRIQRSIRNMVLFRHLNLIDDHYPSPETYTSNIDIIVCRNVTIYFDNATTDKVVARFHQALNEGGWLMVGHSEPQIERYKAFKVHNFANTVLYRKAAPAVVPDKQPPAKISAQSERLARLIPRPEQAPPLAISAQPTVKHHPESTLEEVSLLQRAQQAADREDWAETLRLLDDAERADRLQPQVHYLRALVQLQTSDLDKALDSLRQAIYCDPSFALAQYALGELHEKRGEYTASARCWRQAQSTLAGLAPEYPLPFADDNLTVEMLNGLLTFRLNRLPAHVKE